MYYIYIDEAYNLAPNAKHQLIVIGGFGTSDPKKIAKAYKKIRKFNLTKRQYQLETKSSDRVAIKKLIPKLFKALVGLDIVIYAIRQDKKFIPYKYFEEDKLNYEKLYLDLLIKLIRDEWDLKKHDNISIMADYFHTKTNMPEKILNVLKRKYPNKKFGIQFADSQKDINLQIADLIVGSFYKSFVGGPKIPDFKFEGLRLRIINNIL